MARPVTIFTSIALLLCGSLFPAFTQESGTDDAFPVKISMYPPLPTSNEGISIEGILQASPHIQEVDLLGYEWISDTVLEANVEFIPGDIVPPNEEKTYFIIRLNPLDPGDYTVVFKESGQEIHRMEFSVEKGLTKFPINVRIVPKETAGTFQVDIAGEYPSSGYSIASSNVTADSKIIMVTVEFQEPTGEVLTVITPFHETVGIIPLQDGFYEVVLDVNGRLRSEYPIEVKDSSVEIIVPIPEPQPIPGPLQDVGLRLDPFEPVAGGTVQAVVTGLFSSGAFEITEETVQEEPGLFAIMWTVTEDPIGDTVIVPVKKEYEFSNLEPGNYEVILMINGQGIAHNKFHVKGDIWRPTEGLPFRAELRFDFFLGEEGETCFILAGDFPTAGYTFTDKNVQVDGDRITVTAWIGEPGGAAAEVITPFREPIGTLVLPDIWEKSYFATAVVNGVELKTQEFGGPYWKMASSHPWEWIDIQIDDAQDGKSEVELYLVGEFPTPGYTFANSVIEIVGNQINVRLEVESPEEPQDQVITSFSQKVGSLILADYWQQSYIVNVMINGNPVANQRAGGENIETPVLNWSLQ